MEYLVIPLFFGTITATVGRLKGSSFFIWFLVGAIVPVFGLIAAMMSRNERHDPRRECPRCGKVLTITAQVCTRCGEDLEYPEQLVVPAAHGISPNGDSG